MAVPYFPSLFPLLLGCECHCKLTGFLGPHRWRPIQREAGKSVHRSIHWIARYFWRADVLTRGHYTGFWCWFPGHCSGLLVSSGGGQRRLF